jgi:DNA-binding CsgD family transcriptional regulator
LEETWVHRFTPATARTLEFPCMSSPAATLQSAEGIHRLTRTEARVARLLALRLTNAEIAAQLYISQHTARHHTESVMAKLGVKSRRDVKAD